MAMMQFQYNGKTFLHGTWYDEKGNKIKDPRKEIKKIIQEEEDPIPKQKMEVQMPNPQQQEFIQPGKDEPKQQMEQNEQQGQENNDKNDYNKQKK